VGQRQGALEGLDVSFWRNKRVLITGHTGFKGSWLSLWLAQSGARVTGLALAPDTKPALFDQLGLAQAVDHRIGDIRDADLVAALVRETQPDAVFHFAAQALVLRGYKAPIETWHTNVLGTANLLEALRPLEKPCAAVLVTTDKVYENNEWEFGYRETDPLGGYDPYSASKAAMEIAVASWRRSFFSGDAKVRIATARAGNVIGGGDWAENRIVPDMVRSLAVGLPVKVRSPGAVRPWQHVLEPLSGYLLLAQRLLEGGHEDLQDAFNFGPSHEAERTVREVVEEGLKHWPGTWVDASDPAMPHEAGRLALNIDRARARLGWNPRWSFATAVGQTIGWYRAAAGANAQTLRDLTLAHIRAYEAAAPVEVRA
jgi:CDP-glucose 4,6-dehydratase